MIEVEVRGMSFIIVYVILNQNKIIDSAKKLDVEIFLVQSAT